MANYVWKTMYFTRPSPENTDETLRLAKERAESLKVKNIVVASTTGAIGATDVKASEIFGEGYNLVVVTHVVGFREPNAQEPTPENRAILEKRGVKIVTAGHAFGGIGRSVHKKFNSLHIQKQYYLRKNLRQDAQKNPLRLGNPRIRQITFHQFRH